MIDEKLVYRSRCFFGLWFGGGEHSKIEADLLVERVQAAISELSGLQQGGGLSEVERQASQKYIENVVQDVAAALVGRNIEFTDELDYPPLRITELREPALGQAWQEKNLPETRGIVCQPPAKHNAPPDAVWMMKAIVHRGPDDMLVTDWDRIWIPRDYFEERYVHCPIRAKWKRTVEQPVKE